MQHALWGLVMTGIMYVIGNGVWVNHLTRKKIWWGWLMWAIAGAGILFLGAAFEARLDGQETGIFQRLLTHPNGIPVDPENHWIALSLFALMSVPGAASVIFKQSAYWTRMALMAPALVVFIPAGMQINTQNGDNILAGLAAGLVVSGFILIWQILLDGEAKA